MNHHHNNDVLSWRSDFFFVWHILAAMIAKVPPFAHRSLQRCRPSTHRCTRTPALDKRVTLFSALDDSVISFDPSHAAAAGGAIAPSPGMDPVQSFEPVLNVQAASSFVFIAIVFAVLQLRINAVSRAAKRRTDALSALRECWRSGSGGTEQNGGSGLEPRCRRVGCGVLFAAPRCRL